MLDFLARFYHAHKDVLDNLLSGSLVTIILAVLGGIWAVIWWYRQQKRQGRILPLSLPFPFESVPPGGKVLPVIYKGDVNDTNPLADQNIPYQRRRLDRDYRQELCDALEEHRWVIILGPTGIGKSREAAEVAQRLNNEGWTIVCLKLGAWLDRPTGGQLQALGTDRKLLFFLDDLNQYTRRSLEVEQNPGAKDSPLAPINIPFQERLLETLEYYENYCTRPEEVRVIATARNERQGEGEGLPSEWEKLQWEKYPQLWQKFAVRELPPPEDGAIVDLLQETVPKTDIEHQESDYPDIASCNDTTFRNVVENLVRLHNRQLALTRANYQPTLRGSWEKRYRDAVKRDPLARTLYDTIDLLRQCDVPLTAFIVERTARMMAGGNVWQKLWYRWRIPRSLADLNAREKVLTPRDGQIEGKGKRVEMTDYLSSLVRLMGDLFDRFPTEMTSALVGFTFKLDKLERYRDALKGWNRLVVAFPKVAEGWFYRGNAYEFLEKHLEAIESYDKAIEL